MSSVLKFVDDLVEQTSPADDAPRVEMQEGGLSKTGPKGPMKGSAINKFREFLRKLSPEKIATTNVNDLIKLSGVNVSKTNALNALSEPEFSFRPRREMTKTDKAELQRLLADKKGRTESIQYKGKQYFKGTDGRIRLVRERTLEEKVKQSQQRRGKGLGLGKTGSTNPKMAFWESLIDSHLKAVRPKEESRGINVSRLNPTNVNLKEKLVKGEYLSSPEKRKIKFKDSVTGKTFGFKNLESYMENNIGKGSYKNALDNVKTKTFLNTTFAQVDNKPVSLRFILNESLIPGWTKTNKMQNVFQIHHPFGFARNPFVTQLAFFDDNRKEYNIRSNFFKKLKEEKTLSGKKNLVKNFTEALPPGVLSAPGKKVYGQAFDIPKLLDVAADRADKAGNKKVKKIFESEQFKKEFKEVFKRPLDKSMPQAATKIKNPIGSSGPTLGMNLGLGPALRVAGEVIGSPAAALAFATQTVRDNLRKGENLADAIVDPLVGAELLFPEIAKKAAPGVMKGILGLGRVGRMLTPVGAAITAGGLAVDYGKFVKREIDRIKKMTPEEREQYDAEEQEQMGIAAAKGGLIPPKSGKTPHGDKGLASLADYDMTNTEFINGRY